MHITSSSESLLICVCDNALHQTVIHLLDDAQFHCASQGNVFADEALLQMKLDCIDERVNKMYANDQLTYIEYTFIYTESHLVP